MARLTCNLLAAALLLSAILPTAAGAWDVYVDSVINCVDMCSPEEQPSSKVVPLPWYRGVPYEVWIPDDQAPVYFDSSHLGMFDGVHLDGVLGTTEATRSWVVGCLAPGAPRFAVPPGYQNLRTHAYLPDCGGISDNSGEFNLKVRPTGWGSWPAIPIEGFGSAAVLDPTTGVVYVFGGGCNNAEYSNVTWRLDPRGFGGWEPIHAGPDGPEARWFASAVLDVGPDGSRRMIIFGGASDGQLALSDTWALDLVTETWSPIGTSGDAPACAFHGAILDPNPTGHRRMLVHGDAERIEKRTYALDLVTLEWSELDNGDQAPPLRLMPCVALYEPAEGSRQMIVFAGGYHSNYRNDIWSLNLDSLVWEQLPAGDFLPDGREGSAMAIDSAAGKVIVFGGRNAQTAFDDLWYYDLEGRSWVPVAFPEENWPSARAHHALVYDPAYHAATVLGGYSLSGPCVESTAAVHVTDFAWYADVSAAEPPIGPLSNTASCRVWPVPSSGSVRIEFDLVTSGAVEGAVYDASGARVGTFVNRVLPAGTHSFEWDPRSAGESRTPAGVYFCRIRAAGRNLQSKIIVLE